MLAFEKLLEILIETPMFVNYTFGSKMLDRLGYVTVSSGGASSSCFSIIEGNGALVERSHKVPNIYRDVS